jgi:uncharacterized membrane protein
LNSLFTYLIDLCDNSGKWRERESSLNAIVYLLNEQSTATWLNLSEWMEALWQVWVCVFLNLFLYHMYSHSHRYMCMCLLLSYINVYV